MNLRILVTGLTLALLWACGGGGESGTPDVVDVASGEVAGGDAVEPELPPIKKQWKEIEVARIEGITKVRGFVCGPTQVVADVEGAASKGLYSWQVAGAGGFEKVYDGIGLVAVLDAQVLVAQYGGPNNTASLVGVDAEGQATDLGFAFENLEIRNLLTLDGAIYTLSKDWTTAEYLVHSGTIGGGFNQIGPRVVETGMGFFVTSDKVLMLANAAGALGTVCYENDAKGTADSQWAACPAFPDYVAEKDGQPYSVVAEIYGKDERMALWFRVTDKGVKKWVHYVADSQTKWTELEGFPAVEPTAWFHDGEQVVLGYSAAGDKAPVYTASSEADSPAEPFAFGLPATADKTGVVGFCRADDWLYAAWFEYNAGGSTLSLWRIKD